ncbi:MAG: DUF4139 domain-containing protein [Candidatus Bipolaricaulaceae bacterium]
MRKWLLCMLLSLLVPATLLAGPRLILYSGTALVEETRDVSLETAGTLVLKHLPHGILWDSLAVEGISVRAVRPVLPLRLTADGLVGELVKVVTQGTRVSGRLISQASDGTLVLATQGGMITIKDYSRIDAPLPDREQVEIDYAGATPGGAQLLLRYLTAGLTWRANYRAVVDEGRLSLQGQALVTNATGVAFTDARVDLVAGEVYAPSAPPGAGRGQPLALQLAAAPEADVAPAGEYHRYRLPDAVNLPPGSVAIPYVTADFDCQRVYRFRGAQVETIIKFENMAVPLPAGEVRTYEENGGLFVGAAALPHTPVGEEAELATGVAFDLTGERVQVEHRRLGDEFYRDTYRIEIRSAKDHPVEVEVWESMSGSWTVTQTTHPYEQLDSRTIRFVVDVPPEAKVTIRYTVEWRYG